jgi:hypothetical protein
MKGSNFWNVTPCSLVEVYNDLEELTTSTFWVEEKAKDAPRTQETATSRVL